MSPKKPRCVKKTSQSKVQPDWPIFKPLVPTCHLSLEVLLPSQIILIRDFWTGRLCRNYVNFLKNLPLVTTGMPKKGEAFRFNDRYQILDDSFSNRLWLETGLRELVCGSEYATDGQEGMSKSDRKALWGGEVVGLNPSIRIYRYGKGQFFDQHYDESNIVSLNTKPKATSAITTWTLLLYLSSPATGCNGGETVFYLDEDNMLDRPHPASRELVVKLETGMLLLHKHGNQCLLHEGRKVLEGEKWVIRTDLCVKK